MPALVPALLVSLWATSASSPLSDVYTPSPIAIFIHIGVHIDCDVCLCAANKLTKQKQIKQFSTVYLLSLQRTALRNGPNDYTGLRCACILKTKLKGQVYLSTFFPSSQLTLKHTRQLGHGAQHSKGNCSSVKSMKIHTWVHIFKGNVWSFNLSEK